MAQDSRARAKLCLATVLAAWLLVASSYPASAAEVSWSMVVLPDTQNYANPNTWPILNQMTQWIVDNKDSRNIELVLQEGDITNNNTDTQWAEAAAAMGRLNGQVPYIVTTGNHDYDLLADRSTTKLNDYFHLEDNPLNNSPDGILTTQLRPGKMDNVSSTFVAPDGRKMLVFGLEFIPRGVALDWANSIASQPQYEDYTAVLVTHCYLEEGPATPGGEPTARRHTLGDALWGELVSRHPNFELVLNGHFLDGDDTDPNGPMTTARQSSVGDHGNVVHEIVFNAQEQPKGGNGYLRLMEFLNDGSTVQVRTYSPYLDKWLTDDRNEFRIQLSPALPGDYNHDAVVDLRDYTVWRNAMDVMTMPNDATPGVIDDSDFDVWKANFGRTATGDYNDDGIVNVLDYVVWRNHLDGGVEMLNDQTPGVVDELDFEVWKANFGKATSVGDYNGDGFVDVLDYIVWRNTMGPGEYVPNDATPGVIDESDFDVWKANFGRDTQTMGDYNDDGIVDIRDYTFWRNHMDRKIFLPNDVTPGVVDISDFEVWKTQFGQPFPSSIEAGATNLLQVPEPIAAVLMTGLPLVLLACRRQKLSGVGEGL